MWLIDKVNRVAKSDNSYYVYSQEQLVCQCLSYAQVIGVPAQGRTPPRPVGWVPSSPVTPRPKGTPSNFSEGEEKGFAVDGSLKGGFNYFLGTFLFCWKLKKGVAFSCGFLYSGDSCLTQHSLRISNHENLGASRRY